MKTREDYLNPERLVIPLLKYVGTAYRFVKTMIRIVKGMLGHVLNGQDLFSNADTPDGSFHSKSEKAFCRDYRVSRIRWEKSE